MKRHLVDMCQSLRHEQVTRRRNGAKSLREVLEDGRKCAMIDIMCADRKKTPMWVVIARSCKYFCEQEIAYGKAKNKAVKAEVPGLLLHVIRRADENMHMLHGVAGDLLKHLLTTVDMENGCPEEIAGGYANCLVALFSVPAYANVLDAETIDTTLHILTNAVNRLHRQRACGMFAKVLWTLLQSYANDTHHCLVPAVSFFSAWCQRNDGSDGDAALRDSEVVAPLFRALNAMLRRNASDAGGVLRTYGRSCFAYAQRRFLAASTVEKEVLAEHMLLQLHCAAACISPSTAARHERSKWWIWAELDGLRNLALCAETLQVAVPPALISRRSMKFDTARLLDAPVQRRVLRLAADVIYYDAVRAAQLPLPSGRKRQRRAPSAFQELVHTIRQTLASDAGAGGQSQAPSQGLASPVLNARHSAHGRAHGALLVLCATLARCRPEDIASLADDAGDELVRTLTCIAAVLESQGRNLLLVLLLTSAASLCDAVRSLPLSDTSRKEFSLACASIFSACSREGSKLRTAVTDGSAGSLSDVIVSTMASLIRAGPMSGMGPALLQENVWMCPVFYHPPSDTVAANVLVLVHDVIRSGPIQERADSILIALPSGRPPQRRARLAAYVSLLLAYHLGIKRDGDEEEGQGRLEVPDESVVDSAGKLASCAVRSLAMVHGVSLKEDAEVLDEQLSHRRLIEATVAEPRPQPCGATAKGSRESEHGSLFGASSQAQLAVSAALSHLIQAITKGLCCLDLSFSREDTWRASILLSCAIRAVAQLMKGHAFQAAMEVFLAAVRFLRRHLQHFRDAARGSHEEVAIIGRALESIAAEILTIHEIALGQASLTADVLSIIIEWGGITRDWLSIEASDESSATATTEQQASSRCSTQVSSNVDEDFADETAQSGRASTAMIDSQTTGSSLRIIGALCKVAISCGMDNAETLLAVQIKQDDVELELTAALSVLDFAIHRPSSSLERFATLMDTVEQVLSVKSCTLRALPKCYEVVTRNICQWKRQNEDSAKLLPRIVGLIYPTGKDGVVRALRLCAACREAQLKAARAVLSAYRASNTIQRFLSLLVLRFYDPATTVREEAARSCAVVMGEADPARATEIFSFLQEKIPPLSPRGGDQGLDLEAVSLPHGSMLQREYFNVEHVSFERTALMSLAHMAVRSEALLEEVTFRLLVMHRRQELRHVVERQLRDLALAYGHIGEEALLYDVIEAVISSWLQEGLHLKELPTSLFGFLQEASFYRVHAGRVVPLVILSARTPQRRFEEVQYVADVAGFGANDAGLARLLDTHAVEVYARSIFLSRTASVTACEQYSGFLHRMLPLESAKGRAVSNVHLLVLSTIDCMAGATVRASDLQQTEVTFSELLKSVAQMADSVLGAGQLSMLSSVNAVDVMLHILLRMKSTGVRARQRLLFHSLRTFVAEWSTSLFKSGTIAAAVTVLVHILQQTMAMGPELLLASLDLLCNLHEGGETAWNAHNEKEWARELPKIFLVALVTLRAAAPEDQRRDTRRALLTWVDALRASAKPRAESRSTALGGGWPAKMWACFRELLRGCGAVQGDFLVELSERFPDEECDVGTSREENIFFLQLFSDAVERRIFAVPEDFVATLLPGVFSRMRDMMYDETDLTDEERSSGNLVLQRSAEALCEVARSADARASGIAVAWIGKLGLSMFCRAVPDVATSFHDRSAILIVDRSSARRSSDQTAVSKVLALNKVVHILLGSDRENADLARRTLMVIRGHEGSGQDSARHIVENTLASIISCYACPSVEALCNEHATRRWPEAKPSAFSPLVEELAAGDFDRWLVELTCNLLAEHRERGGDSFWWHFYELCERSVGLSKLVLPAVAFELTKLGGSGRFLEQLRHFLVDCVFASDAVLDEVTSFCIAVLHYMGDKQNFAFAALSDPAAAKPKGSRAALGRAELPYNGFLRQDFFLAAKAAMRCGAYCSALAFVEWWVDFNVCSPSVLMSEIDGRKEGQHARGMVTSSVSVGEVQELLYGIFTALGDGDAARVFEVPLQARAATCIPVDFLAPGTARLSGCRTEEGGVKALQTLTAFDATLGSGADERKAAHGTAAALRELGLFNVLASFVSCRDVGAADLRAEASWRSNSRPQVLAAPSSEVLADPRTSASAICTFQGTLHDLLNGFREGSAMEIATQREKGAAACGRFFDKVLKAETKPQLTRAVAMCQAVEDVWAEWEQSTTPRLWKSSLDASLPFSVPFSDIDLVVEVRSRILHDATLRPGAVKSKRVVGLSPVSLSVQSCRTARDRGLFQRAQACLERGRPFIATAHSDASKWFSAEEASADLNVALDRLRHLCDWHMEHAELDWRTGQRDRAIQGLQVLESVLTDHVRAAAEEFGTGARAFVDCEISRALSRRGEYLAGSRSESSAAVLKKYLRPACSLAPLKSPGLLARKAASDAAFALARYASSLFERLEQRRASSEWTERIRVAEQRKRELLRCEEVSSQIERGDPAYAPTMRHTIYLRRECALDDSEITSLEASVEAYFMESLKAFLKAMSRSDDADGEAVSRVIALWFAKQTRAASEQVKDLGQYVPSYKFVPLMYQIVSRLGAPSDMDASKVFQQTLTNLVFRLCRKHPHHCVIQLIAIANGALVAGTSGTQFRQNTDQGKIRAAERIIGSLVRSEGSGVAGLTASTRRLAAVYMDLAQADTKSYHSKSVRRISLRSVLPAQGDSFGTICRALRSEPQESVPCIFTKVPAIRQDGKYERHAVRVQSFEDAFRITDSGIHRPKIIYCLGSDGKRYRQLVKGEDDTRQDAVMQQAFSVVNALLAKDAAASSKGLRIVTYRIVPLSPESGVLEWVENTQPFSQFLIDQRNKSRGAHQRYYPGDLSHAACRKKMKDAMGRELALARAAYDKVCEGFRPVFRFFFIEHFGVAPETLLAARRKYTHSVACSSIVGHILGIGDRHANNILTRLDTGEVVHIDFGVTFEQGHTLAAPETVPFRLTRDVVDGMGVTGTHGAFSVSCADTLRVLRKSRDSLLTILDVLMHDPLFRWMLSPAEARQVQRTDREDEEDSDDGGDPGEGTEAMDVPVAAPQQPSARTSQGDAAARALMRIRQKLNGYEDAHGDALSVEGQVKLLVTQAQDPDNLCRLFYGWSAWL